MDKGNANSLAKIIATQKQLRVLSLGHCRLSGEDINMFCERGLSHAKNLVYFDLSENSIGLIGIQHLFGTGLRYCKSVRYLDLFGVNLSTDAISVMEECIR